MLTIVILTAARHVKTRFRSEVKVGYRQAKGVVGVCEWRSARTGFIEDEAPRNQLACGMKFGFITSTAAPGFGFLRATIPPGLLSRAGPTYVPGTESQLNFEYSSDEQWSWGEVDVARIAFLD